MDLNEVDVYLISGFPMLEFSNKQSLLAKGCDLNAFLNGMSQAFRPNNQNIMSQAVIFNNISPNMSFDQGTPAPQNTPGDLDGIDMHYEHVGSCTIAKGEDHS